jgi:hypothetical protein
MTTWFWYYRKWSQSSFSSGKILQPAVQSMNITGLHGISWCWGILLDSHWESASGWPNNVQVVPPLSKVMGVLRQLHGGSSREHIGINKTLVKVRQQYYWLHMRSNAGRLCQQCNTCAVNRSPWTGRRSLLQQCNVGARFQRISVDIEWPLPENQQRNWYLLIIMDFSPSSRRFAPSLTKKHWLWQMSLWPTPFCHFEVPRELHNDRGWNLE